MRWAALAALSRANVTVGRVTEAHTDALAIRAEAGLSDAGDRTWGVFAAEGGDRPLRARPVTGGYVLDGHKPWCSLGGVLDAGLVTAHVDGGRRLFEVNLRGPGITARPASGWVSRGLPTVTVSDSTSMARLPNQWARPIGT